MWRNKLAHSHGVREVAGAGPAIPTNMDDFYQKLLEASFRFLSFRPRSEKEVQDFLKKKTPDTKLRDRVINRLHELGYLDDAKFTKWWIDQRTAHRPKGARLIAQELKAKGVEAKGIRLDERLLAKQAIAKKLDLWRRLPKLEQKKKLYGFLGRRGFATEVIHRVIDEVVDNKVQ